MKKFILFLFLILALNGTSFGQFSDRLKLIIGGGVGYPKESFLLKDTFVELEFEANPTASLFEEYWQNGIAINAGLGYELNRYFEVELGFFYSTFSFNENRLKEDIKSLMPSFVNIVDFNTYRGTSNFYSFSLLTKFMFPTKIISPYLTGGGGMMFINQEPVEISNLSDPLEASFSFRFKEETSENFMGILGGGFFIPLTKTVSPFLEADYIIGFSDKENTIYYVIKGGIIFSIR